MTDHALFSEVQAFHQNLVVRIVVPLVVVAVGGGLCAAAASGGPVVPILGVVALVVLVPLPLMLMKMRTTVTEAELRFEMLPFLRRRLPIESIDEVEAVRYNPMVNGGGWGVRLCSRYGLVVNVSGSRGVRIVAGRKRYLLGSRHSEVLAAAIAVAREAACAAPLSHPAASDSPSASDPSDYSPQDA